MNTKEKKIVCLGGGIGTVNLIKGLRKYTKNITVVVSMADEGGSSGRLRRLYGVFPPGDIVSCMSALVEEKKVLLEKLLIYRFPGNRYGKDDKLSGHKLGNLIFVGLQKISGDFYTSIEKFQALFNISGTFLPATSEQVTISAKTIEGKIVVGEEKIDLGKYNGKRILEHVYLHPENAKPGKNVVEHILQSDVIVAGPGDLYTTTLPVLIVPEIKKAVIESNALKLFVVNIANKPFETKGYVVSDYMYALEKHIEVFPFQKIIVNNNFSLKIPKKFHYNYVAVNGFQPSKRVAILEKDLVNEEFPLYHNPYKLANAIVKEL